jgi:hypothetical protein
MTNRSPEDHAKRRQLIARHIHSLWTQGGSDMSGLAEPLFDGRTDALGSYLISSLDFQMHASSKIDRVDCKDLSYDDFVEKYMRPNQPVVIQGLTKGWRAVSDWTKEDGLVPNLQNLSDRFGKDVCQVYEQVTSGFSEARPSLQTMSLAEYADWWELYHSSTETEDGEQPLLYWKDWKFVAAHPTYQAYEWPLYFQDDWLNDASDSLYKFCYLGPKGTCTVLHEDVLR